MIVCSYALSNMLELIDMLSYTDTWWLKQYIHILPRLNWFCMSRIQVWLIHCMSAAYCTESCIFYETLNLRNRHFCFIRTWSVSIDDTFHKKNHGEPHSQRLCKILPLGGEVFALEDTLNETRQIYAPRFSKLKPPIFDDFLGQIVYTWDQWVHAWSVDQDPGRTLHNVTSFLFLTFKQCAQPWQTLLESTTLLQARGADVLSLSKPHRQVPRCGFSGTVRLSPPHFSDTVTAG